MSLLCLDNVFCQLNTASGATHGVLNGVTLDIDAGEFVVLIGASGGGKTTLLKTLIRLEEPSSGRIRYHDRPLSEYHPADLRRNITLLMQRSVMFPGTVRENILLPCRFLRSAKADQFEKRLQACLDFCCLTPELLERPASELSVGQQQRVSLARALMLEPQVLLADEPTSALDRPTANQIIESLRRYSRQPGRAAVMTSHDLELAARFADKLVFIDGGRVAEQGPPQQLLHEPRSEALKLFLAQPVSGGLHD